jgi:hypothetical protein
VILLSAVGIGLLVGIGKARWQGRAYFIPSVSYFWLVVLAYLPQLLMSFLTIKQVHVSVEAAGAILVTSLGMLLFFVWSNRHLPGMPMLMSGLIMNLAVMVLNGGLMPISPQTANHLVNREVLPSMELGDRFGGKDVLLLKQDTYLEILSDRFLLPDWFPYQIAFSLGDVLIGAGAFWFLVVNHQEK